jgi:hypothetical protein
LQTSPQEDPLPPPPPYTVPAPTASSARKQTPTADNTTIFPVTQPRQRQRSTGSASVRTPRDTTTIADHKAIGILCDNLTEKEKTHLGCNFLTFPQSLQTTKGPQNNGKRIYYQYHRTYNYGGGEFVPHEGLSFRRRMKGIIDSHCIIVIMTQCYTPGRHYGVLGFLTMVTVLTLNTGSIKREVKQSQLALYAKRQ